jgi:hypothetical protein
MTVESKRLGEAPAVVLINPKYDYNVGGAMRSCSCWDVHQLWWTGNRVRFEPTSSGKKASKKRLPREERMKGYMGVTLHSGSSLYESIVGRGSCAV